MPKAVIVQGGGPTPVINASLAGAVLEAQKHGFQVLGAEHGLQGILRERFFDLTNTPAESIAQISRAPGAALESSRDKLTPADMDQLLSKLRRHDIHCLWHIGGNGSMGTALDMERASVAVGYELQVIGIPKTVDNDLIGTDHTPGYGSSGRFYAQAVRDIGMDHRALPSPILICEVIGRNVGWLVAATAFARHYTDDAPHLIYCPERPLPREKLLGDIEEVYRRLGRVFVTICEGQRDENGHPFDADVDRPENPQHRLASNLAHVVSRLVTRELKLRARSERPSLLGRCCSSAVSKTDHKEAKLVGKSAVLAARAGETSKMVGLSRLETSVYKCSTVLVPITEVARRERTLPDGFICKSGRDVTESYLKYARTLVGRIEPHERLKGLDGD